MILTATIEEKSFGDKRLFRDASFFVDDGEKVGIIGRNGEGKTTLFRVLAGEDKDFQGSVSFGKGVSHISTRQEHHGFEDMTVIDYIVQDLPDFIRLKHILDTYPETMGDDMKLIHEYSEALEQFDAKGYYTIDNEVDKVLSSFQLEERANDPLRALSGGQKRLVEVTKVMLSRTRIALIDEPTNHMDYVAKEKFMQWMVSAQEAMLVITHDRDVLEKVDRILEVKDQKIISYKGNYTQYLRQNSSSTGSQMNEYELTQRRMVNLKAKIIEYQRFKEKSRHPSTIQRFKRLEQQSRDELARLEKTEKPTFWVDRESVQDMGLKSGAQYQKFKAKNIRLHGAEAAEGHSRLLVDVSGLSLGYDKPLFSDVSFQIREGDIVELRGRNGAGKTTLVSALLATLHETKLKATAYAGHIDLEKKIRVGVYEQEISSELFSMPLGAAIEHIYLSRGLKIGETKTRQLMSDYLFVQNDANIPVAQLSGGQKARLQLIAMLADNPSLLILDEPTNHLDLPSIEELESALKAYTGAVLYISHDTFFRENIGGDRVQL
ncbi:ABC-F family ATP-binding cassette domain-containing protein [Candidatus Saccharibacteria bacterium]|nr:ABC-F family ATP-binding cassette domain-containing protein [Candidatus Saccharibacteria bacterium]NCS82830.1 ABC-F family ATP-binding cassette domain-containing protein [Candidatus Saccharibacteria bacterium]